MASSDSQAKILTLVFTDLADSTALKSQRGDDAMDELLTRHREHVARLADECQGRIIDWAGDGCFLTFDTSSAAVMFSLRLQQAHSDEADLPGVRIGVHLGEVTEKSGPDGATQVKGLAVDVAARVSSLSKPGQVLMSSAVYNSAKQRMGVDSIGQPILWQLHGLYDLKGFDHPLEIAEAGLEGFAPLEAPSAGEKVQPISTQRFTPMFTFSRHHLLIWIVLLVGFLVMPLLTILGVNLLEKANETADMLDTSITSIAVLPFDNLSSDPEQVYFVDGMTEALTMELAKIKSIKVVSRTSAMQYKETDKSMPEIARELGADALIEGSVMKIGNEVRITAQLVHGATDEHLWADSFDSTLENILKLHSEVALSIAKEVHAVVTPQEAQQFASTKSVSSEAHDLYLRGTHLSRRSTEQGLDEGLELLRQATLLAPDYAPAFAELANQLGNRAAWGYRSAQIDLENGLTAARTAVRLEPSLAEAHDALGWILWTKNWDWKAIETESLRALELDPESSAVRVDYVWFLSYSGRADEAIEQAMEALRLDPLDLHAHFAAARAYNNARRFDEAIEIAQRARQLNPSFFPALLDLGNAYTYKGDPEQALEILKLAVTESKREAHTLSGLGVAHAHLGDTDAANALLEEIQTKRDNNTAPIYPLATLYAQLGKLDEAFETLEQAFEAREWLVTDLAVWAAWDPLRNDPRFQAFVDRLNLPTSPPSSEVE